MQKLLSFIGIILTVALILVIIGCQPQVVQGNMTKISDENQKSYGVIKGRVNIAPLCPVEPCQLTDEQKAKVFSERKVFIYDSSHHYITQVTPDINGDYRTQLETGSYIVDIEHAAIGSVAGAPTSVDLGPEQQVTLNIEIDTGIR